MVLFVIISSLWLSWAGAPEQARTESQSDPVAVALDAAHRDYEARASDQFADTQDVSGLEDRKFTITIPFGDGQSLTNPPQGSAFYTYEDGALRLILSAGLPSGDELSSNYHLIRIDKKSNAVDRFVGSNAFGAKAAVTVRKEKEYSLAFFNAPDGERSPFSDTTPMVSVGPRTDYWVRLPLSGRAARLLATKAIVRIRGTIERLESGHLTGCRSLYREAVIDAPTRAYGQNCWVGAHISSIEFINSGTGEVLKEWKSAD